MAVLLLNRLTYGLFRAEPRRHYAEGGGQTESRVGVKIPADRRRTDPSRVRVAGVGRRF